MKLIINNFTGYLETGERYKIVVESEFVSSLGQYQLSAHLKKEFENLEVFMWEDTICEWYKKGKENYKVALRNALIKMEEKYNLKLLKGNLKVAQNERDFN